KEMREFMKTHFIAQNMVVTGAGIAHSELVAVAKEVFGEVPSGSVQSIPAEEFKYQGGDVRVRADSPLTHVGICFDAGKGWESPDLVTICVLHMLLGGGSS